MSKFLAKIFVIAAGNGTCFTSTLRTTAVKDATPKEEHLSEFTHRNASLRDMGALWALVRHAASDIPCSIESESDQERALTEIMKCCTAELSLVALDADRNLVGAVLARRDELDWGLRDKVTINVSLAAVSAACRDENLFKTLIDELRKRNAPIYIVAKPGEAQGLGDALKGSGFSLVQSDECGELFKWEPAPAVAA